MSKVQVITSEYSGKRIFSVSMVVIGALAIALPIAVVLFAVTRFNFGELVLHDGWKAGLVVNIHTTARTYTPFFNIDTGNSNFLILYPDTRYDRRINQLEVGDSIEFVRNSNVARIKRKGATTWTTVKKLREQD